MESRPRQLYYYQKIDGTSPFRDWFNELRDLKAKATIEIRLDRVEDGNFGYHRWVGEGVWELKIDVGPGYRVYYGLDGPILVLILSGGDKRTQNADIKQAHKNWADYLARKPKK